MNVGAWVRAARLPSQSYIALPLVLGQLLAWRATGHWSWPVFIGVQLFGVFDQLYIVFANDVADVETDRRNETSTIFSGGSRVLVEGSITEKALRRAAVLMVVLSLLVGVVLWAVWGHAWPLPLIALGLALLWAYSFGPIRLSYRGGGELLQTVGVGAVLPLIGWSAQAGSLDGFPWILLGALLPMNLATAISTALPDEPSDRASDKRTWPVLVGPRFARATIIVSNLTGLALFWAFGPQIAAGLDANPAAVVAVPLVAIAILAVLSPGARAGTRRVLAFVFFGILANLAFAAGLIVDLLPGG
jgi:1,4-dihydroxy-2-naphthoate octaprenyltransferase